MVDIIWYGKSIHETFTIAKFLAFSASIYGNKDSLVIPSFKQESMNLPAIIITKIDDKKIIDRSIPSKADYIVIYDESVFDDTLFSGLKENGKIIINTRDSEKYKKYGGLLIYEKEKVDEFSVPLIFGLTGFSGRKRDNPNYQKRVIKLNKIITVDANLLSEEMLGDKMPDMAMLGVLLAVSNIIPSDAVINAIKSQFNENSAIRFIELFEYSYNTQKDSLI